ncbi:MAG: hypothetical protein JW818_12070 [Pirellulales bacterium]|nr:hypothetical protein [Pirellulales bacterium]
MVRSSLGVLVILTVGGGVFSMAARPCSGQFIFNKINPGEIITRSIDPKALRRQPIETEAKPTKPYAPMPHFHNRNALSSLPDRIEMAPIAQPQIHGSHIRPDRITFGPMVQTNIAPQHIRMDPLVRTIEPGRRMTAPVTPSQPKWFFSKQLEGHAKPTERFDSSLYLKQKDYNVARPASSNRRDVPSHPMSW